MFRVISKHDGAHNTLSLGSSIYLILCNFSQSSNFAQNSQYIFLGSSPRLEIQYSPYCSLVVVSMLDLLEGCSWILFDFFKWSHSNLLP